MSYERITGPPSELYHYTNRSNLESILHDGRIRRFGDAECWFCASTEDTLRLMELTVMNEGQKYIAVGGAIRQYPTFVPEDYIILKVEPRYQNGDWVRWNQEIPQGSPAELRELAVEFSSLKIGFRGDLKFKKSPEVMEVSALLELSEQQYTISQQEM